MKILNLGGATAILEQNGKRILFDPWLDDGIFHGSWYHFPPAAIGAEEMGHIDYVYISHIHEDHCSAGTIKHINPDAEIILMDRKPNLVLNFLESNGFQFKKIHLIKPRTPVEVEPGLIVDIVEANPADEMARLIDSSIVITWGGFTIYNANDCQPHQEGIQYLLRQYGRLDLALLPYSGGSGYPSCYINLTDEEKLAEKDRILRARVASFVEVAKRLNPVYVMPFADQWAVGGSRSHLNKFVSHSSCRGVVEAPFHEADLPSKLLLLNSGQQFDFSTQKKLPQTPYQYQSDEDREQYVLTALSNAVYDHESLFFNTGVPLNRLIKYARARQWGIQEKQKFFPLYSFYLDTNDTQQRFHIPLDSPEVHEVSPELPLAEPYLRIAAPRSLLIMLLIGHISWNIADAAFFLDYERAPNQYDPQIYALLNYLKV
jgi:UDP-MurNAc hydroxylase